MPIPISPRMDNSIHGSLHLVKIISLIDKRLIIYASHVRIKRAKQNRDIGSHSMYCSFTHIIESGKAVRGNIEERDSSHILLHLLVTTLHSIGIGMRDIIQGGSIVQATIITALTVS